MTECTDCDRRAVAFHGALAYCKSHLVDAIAENPHAHDCPVCHTAQPDHVLWEGRTCGLCKQAGGRAWANL